MRILTRRRVLALLDALAATIAAIAPATPAFAAPPPASATASALLDAFATHQIVALGQVHDLRQQDDFILDLLNHPRFAETVDSIVVEFGNARFQSRVDRYVAGGRVSRPALQHVWRDPVGSGPGDHDGAAPFYLAVRRLNRTLPRNDRIRVRLGDPAFDWSRRGAPARSCAPSPAATTCSSPPPSARREPGATSSCSRASATSCAVHRAAAKPATRSSASSEARPVGSGPCCLTAACRSSSTTSSAASSPRSPRSRCSRSPASSGDLPADRFLPRPLIPGPGLALRDLADALISFGPCAQLRFAKLSRAPFRDRGYLRELDRRNRILFGRPFVMPVLPSANAPCCPGSA